MLIYLYFVDTPVDKEKFEKIYLLYRAKMFYVANKVLHDTYGAEDAVQNAFISIARNISKIDDADSRRTQAYVTVAARNSAYDIIKGKIPTEELKDYNLVNTELDRALDDICSKETYDKIVEIINGFDDIYRDVLYLHYVEEYSAGEIAKLFDRKLPTVKRQLVRGKKILLEAIRRELSIK